MDLIHGLDFASVLEGAPDAVVLVDPNGIVLYANARTERLFGCSRDAIVGHAIEMLLPERLRAEHVRHRVEYMADPRERTLDLDRDLMALRKDGREIPVEVSLVPVRAGGVTYIRVTIRDATERKRALQEVDRLRRQHELILGSVAEGILGIDAAGTITFANHAAAKHLGYPHKELIGQPEHALLHARRADGSSYPEALCPIRRSVEDGGTHHASGEVFTRKDGTPLSVEYTSAPINENGKLVGASVIFVDTSQRARARGPERQPGIARSLARRIVQDLVEQGAVAHQTLTQVGRALAADTPGDSIEAHLLAYEEMGLGKVEMEKQEGMRYTFAGEDLLERQPGARVATCSFTLGYLSQTVSNAHGADPTLGTEIACQSRGAPRCRFVVQVRRAEEGLARRVKELI